MQPPAVVLCAFTARRPARPAGSVLGGGGSGPMRRQFYRGWGSDVRGPARPAGSVLGGGGSGPMRRQFYRGWGSGIGCTPSGVPRDEWMDAMHMPLCQVGGLHSPLNGPCSATRQHCVGCLGLGWSMSGLGLIW
jgi:hypothetical protein